MSFLQSMSTFHLINSIKQQQENKMRTVRDIKLPQKHTKGLIKQQLHANDCICVLCVSVSVAEV